MLSKRLKLARNKTRLTQDELAKKVNTTKATISNYENGHSTPSNEMLVLLANVLNTTTDYLLGRDMIQLEKDNEDKDEEEFLKWMDDPTTDLFFREYINSPEEMKAQLRKIWDIIKNTPN
ncbi:helix-turn-helix transcriptional regulator [Psychrobacillus sp.]|uniref:helix-turn-helix domain-containing protein n=1 Tax=Psychrobacillus sp. TaxID=1871623 RepID=UPI0028BD6A0F|nr:helix-turn-helix transcriptional regulator [Psychrobacillus sp.]